MFSTVFGCLFSCGSRRRVFYFIVQFMFIHLFTSPMDGLPAFTYIVERKRFRLIFGRKMLSWQAVRVTQTAFLYTEHRFIIIITRSRKSIEKRVIKFIKYCFESELLRVRFCGKIEKETAYKSISAFMLSLAFADAHKLLFAFCLSNDVLMRRSHLQLPRSFISGRDGGLGRRAWRFPSPAAARGSVRGRAGNIARAASPARTLCRPA